MDLGNNDDGRKQARGKPKVNEENFNRVIEVNDENPPISIRKAGQHLNLSYYASRVLIRKEISFLSYKRQVTFQDTLDIFSK